MQKDRIASLGWSMTSEIDYLPEIWKDVMLDNFQVKGAFPMVQVMINDLKKMSEVFVL